MTDGNDANLSALEHRLDELEDGLRVEYPTAETPGGGAQRLRLEVPTPWSLMTIGARGTGASDGRAVGPGGFALMTVESFGAEIQGNTCIDTDGLTIVHSIGASRMLTQADLGIAANAAMRLGTNEGNLELTAGHVPANDPAFKVIPSMAVPGAPRVDTGGPRAATEAEKEAASALWDALEVASSINTWVGFVRSLSLTSGIAAGTLFARAAGVVNAVRTAWAIGEAAIAAGAAAAVGFDLDQLDAISSDAPKAKIHGAGGVSLTSPAGVSAYAPKISLTGRETASLKGALKVSVKSAGYASLYGGATTSVSSEGPAVLKSTQSAATISGKFAEVSGKQATAVRSDGSVMIAAKTALSAESPTIAVGGGRDVYISSGDTAEVEAPYVMTSARRQNTVYSEQKVSVQARQRIEMQVGSTKLEVTDSEVRINVGGGAVVADRRSVRAWGFRVDRSGRTRIPGPTDIG